ncbi:hypothetical protein LguiA_022518 [Lonicera macranthoides]
MMEIDDHGQQEQEEIREPVSPTGQFLKSSVLSLSIVAVLESEIPIDDSNTFSLLQDVFLPINPRFSSIMVEEKNGVKKWKRVKVNLKDHINTPTFPKIENPPHLYDQHLNNYLSNLASSQFPQDQPLWEIHVIKYPTTTAAGHLIFKLHHALGDGYSLVGALLSCLQRVDNPSLPLTFPSLKSNPEKKKNNKVLKFVKCVPKVFLGVFNTLYDFGWEVLKSSVLEDDVSPIRSGVKGVELQPMVITTITFHLDRVKEIKTKLKVTVNDVIIGVIFFGCRLYMEETSYESRKAHSTALVLLNTRNISGYKSVSEMTKPKSDMPWGNNFAFLNLSIPKLSDQKSSNPLEFIYKAHKLIKRKRNSAAVYLTGRLLEALRKFRGPEVASKYIHNTLKNSSTGVSNVIGPVEQMALADHPCKGLYFSIVGAPQSIAITMISYVGKLRIAFAMEEGFVDQQKFKSSIENAFEIMFKAALHSPN